MANFFVSLLFALINSEQSGNWVSEEIEIEIEIKIECSNKVRYTAKYYVRTSYSMYCNLRYSYRTVRIHHSTIVDRYCKY